MTNARDRSPSVPDSPVDGAPAKDDKQLGLAYFERGHYGDALAAFDRAIALDRNDPVAWMYRGNALSALHRQAEALGAYDRAVALRPDYHLAWFNRGLLFAEMGAYGNALESYQAAIACHADPRYLHARDRIWLHKKLQPC